MFEHFKKALAWSIALGMVAWAAFIALFVVGPKLETEFLPVISDVQAAVVEHDKEREVVHITAYGTKTRPCKWEGITALVLKDGTWQEGRVYSTDPRKPAASREFLTTRPVGAQSLGEIFVFPAGEKLQVHLYHSCHPLWQTHTKLYELDLVKNSRR